MAQQVTHTTTSPQSIVIALNAFAGIEKLKRVPPANQKNAIKILSGPTRIDLIISFASRLPVTFGIKLPNSNRVDYFSARIQSLSYVDNDSDKFCFEFEGSVLETLYNQGMYNTKNQQGSYRWRVGPVASKAPSGGRFILFSDSTLTLMSIMDRCDRHFPLNAYQAFKATKYDRKRKEYYGKKSVFLLALFISARCSSSSGVIYPDVVTSELCPILGRIVSSETPNRSFVLA